MKKGKRLLATILILSMVVVVFTGCAGSKEEESNYYSVIAKGFQHQFWQVVKAGSEQAAADLGVEIFFTGPEGESSQAAQVDMLNAELAKNPKAIALAALNTEAIFSQLQEAYDKGIPIIGFDSGVPNAPEGQIAATASTNNEVAAAIGAEHMYEAIKVDITAATVNAPVTVVVLSQDATSASVTGRSKGFAEKMYTLVTEGGQSAAITGDFAAITTGDASAVAVNIKIVVGATPDITDMTNAASGVLNTENLLGVFCSNEGAVNGLLASVNSGSEIADGVKIVGFDAGAGQKAAVKSGVFMGSITQDPYQIGYKAVEMAIIAARGHEVKDVDTGAKWYDADNMDEADIAQLLYD